MCSPSGPISRGWSDKMIKAGITKIPTWRKIRRFITKHLFGYVNV
ncbi:hypothetical protein LCGC14_2397420, partial [marine sediment metagenome]